MSNAMHALSIRQPWADRFFIPNAEGRLKSIETRTYDIWYRGPLLICASKTLDEEALEVGECPDDYPLGFKRGVAVGVVYLLESRKMTPEDEEQALCGHAAGLWAWVTDSPMGVDPFEVRGLQGIFQALVPADQMEQIAIWMEKHRTSP